MNVVYDTNVYISALFWDGCPGSLIRSAAKGDVRLIVSEKILEEIKVVLRRSFEVDANDIENIIKTYEKIAVKVCPKTQVDVVRDKKDNHVIECALESNCEYIVTGDNDLLSLKKYKYIQIVKPKDFEKVLNQ